ncbi:MAG TPA: tetratricopeptide repeat protein [Thermoanaerobaculia bacterium]|nr:tetratricopeptide repeat protein [Thermoanaerobaculia bacterium]
MRRGRKQVDGQEFEQLKAAWLAAIEVGCLAEAKSLIERGLAWAEEHGDRLRVDTAVCARSSIQIQLRQGEKEIGHLREILLRSSDPANARLAAYNLSIYYQYAENYTKSLFYARLALDRSQRLGRTDWLASAHNQLGNALLGANSVTEACREYETALNLVVAESLAWRSSVLTNLGYCHLLEGRMQEGFACLFRSVRLGIHRGNGFIRILPHLDLCFAYLEIGRHDRARAHGEKALALAESFGEADSIKNALYLLGETANLMGDQAQALEYFERLRRDFFPASPYLAQFLLAVDVRKIVNLHA